MAAAPARHPAASTTATQPQAQVEAQANLVPPNNRKGLKALGVVLVQKSQGQDQIVAAVQGLPKPKSGGYGIWLYSGPGKAQWLGFFASQDQQGRLLARGQLKTLDRRLPRGPRHARGEGQPVAARPGLPARAASDPERGERRLIGGNLTGAERVGATVRRAAGPWTDTVHALLRHVRARGVTEVPEPLGRDDRGREVLRFLPGEVHHYPMPGWMWADAVLLAAAALLRRYHDATVDFDPPDRVLAAARRASRPRSSATTTSRRTTSCSAARTLAGAIDFDTASPGPRAWTSRTSPTAWCR